MVLRGRGEARAGATACGAVLEGGGGAHGARLFYDYHHHHLVLPVAQKGSPAPIP